MDGITQRQGAPMLAARAVFSTSGETHLRDVSLTFPRGSFNAVLGSSGSGKKLLVQVLGLLHEPEAGDVLLEGESTKALSDEARAALRSSRFGYVFAAPFLLTSFTVLENVAMPLFRIGQLDPAQARPRCEDLLNFVGLADAAQKPVAVLPLATQHAVSLARGLANEPALLIVEDVTADLELAEAHQFTDLLRRAPSVFGTTVIVAAPASFAAGSDDRVIELSDGAVHRDSLIESMRV